jgi:glucose-1-phosphate thymidylyltransferase
VRGIIVAGGTGSRLWPITRAVSKQLIPIHDKPMIYYPLSTLVMAGVREILVVTTPQDRASFQRLLGDGTQWGLRLTYGVQPRPDGVAQVLTIGADFLAGDDAAVILGDNFFHGAGLGRQLQSAGPLDGARIFAYPMADPSPYGVVEFDAAGRVLSIEEKPERPKSHYAVPGLYFYDREAVLIAHRLRPGRRGEVEITALNQEYLRRDRLAVTVLNRGTVWLDAGTFDALANASDYVRVVEERQGFKIGCVEETAWRAGFVDDVRLRALAGDLRCSGYGDYLLQLLDWEKASPELSR